MLVLDVPIGCFKVLGGGLEFKESPGLERLVDKVLLSREIVVILTSVNVKSHGHVSTRTPYRKGQYGGQLGAPNG